MTPESGEWRRSLRGVRGVAFLGLVVLMLGGQCSRSVGIDAVVGPPTAADVAAWCRLESARGTAVPDRASVERILAATTRGLDAREVWLEGRWRSQIERFEAMGPANTDVTPVEALERWRRWRSLATDADRARNDARASDAAAIAEIVDAMSLDADAAGRFERWWRLERAARLAGGFAPRGGTPASPERIVAGGLRALAPEVAGGVIDALDRTATARADAVEAWAIARRDLALLDLASPRAEWYGVSLDDPKTREAVDELAAVRASAAKAFGEARAKVTALTVVAFQDAAKAAAPERIADRWRRFAARLAVGELPSPARHAKKLGDARRGAGDDAEAIAGIDEADRRFRERSGSLEAELLRAMELGDATTLATVVDEVRRKAVSVASERDAALKPFIVVDRFPLPTVAPEDDGWGDLVIESKSMGPGELSELVVFSRNLLLPPSRSGDEGPTAFGLSDDPVVAVVVERHDEIYRAAVARALGEMFDEIAMIMEGGDDAVASEYDRRERAYRGVRRRIESLVSTLNEVDADLAASLVAATPEGLDVASVDRWLARRMRGRIEVSPALAIVALKQGGSLVLVGGWARFERAVAQAGLTPAGRVAALRIEDDLADRLGAFRQSVNTAILDDLEPLVRDSEGFDRGSTAWPHLRGLREREGVLDRSVRASVAAGLPDREAARLLDAWAIERNPGLADWFAIGPDGFETADRFAAAHDDRLGVSVALDAWVSRRAMLRDEVDAWWSAHPEPPAVSGEADRLESMRRSPEMIHAEATRRDLDGRLALELIAMLGRSALDDPFVQRLIAAPVPIGLRLSASADEPIDADELLDLDATDSPGLPR